METDQEQLDRLIRDWYRLATGQAIDASDVFFRFVAVWVAFNALYSSRASREAGDRNQVRAYATRRNVIDRHRKLLSMDGAYGDALSILTERGVYDVASGEHLQINDPRNLSDVARCLYQVRCNLFHGGKAPTSLRDKGLVEASYTIVAKLIEPDVRFSA